MGKKAKARRDDLAFVLASVRRRPGPVAAALAGLDATDGMDVVGRRLRSMKEQERRIRW